MAETLQGVQIQDEVLTNVLIHYQNPRYVYRAICPILQVVNLSGQIQQTRRSDHFRDTLEPVALGAPTSSGFRYGTPITYYAQEYGSRYELYDKMVRNTQRPFDLEVQGTRWLSDRIEMRAEREFTTKMFIAGVWAGDLDGATADFVQWDDYTNGNPQRDIDVWRIAQHNRGTEYPNNAVLGEVAWPSVKWHPRVLETIKYTQIGVMTTGILAASVGLDSIQLGNSLFTASPPETAEASVVYQQIWGNAFLMTYTPPAPALNVPSACYAVVATANSGQESRVIRHRMESDYMTALDGFSDRTTVLCDSTSGTFAINVIT